MMGVEIVDDWLKSVSLQVCDCNGKRRVFVHIDSNALHYVLFVHWKADDTQRTSARVRFLRRQGPNLVTINLFVLDITCPIFSYILIFRLFDLLDLCILKEKS